MSKRINSLITTDRPEPASGLPGGLEVPPSAIAETESNNASVKPATSLFTVLTPFCESSRDGSTLILRQEASEHVKEFARIRERSPLDGLRFCRDRLQDADPDDVDQALIWSANVAICQRGMADYVSALNTHLSVRPMFRYGNRLWVGCHYHGLGQTYHALKDFDSSLKFYLLARDKYLSSPVWAASTNNELARLLADMKRFDEAHEHVNQAIEAWRSLDEAAYVAEGRDTRATILFAEGRQREALAEAYAAAAEMVKAFKEPSSARKTIGKIERAMR